MRIEFKIEPVAVFAEVCSVACFFVVLCDFEGTVIKLQIIVFFADTHCL